MTNQLLINGLITLSGVLCISVAFLCCHLALRFYDFSLPGCCMVGAYCAYELARRGVPTVIAFALAGGAAGFFNLLLSRYLYGRLSDIGGSSAIQLLASLAVYIIAVNGAGLLYGGDIKLLGSQVQVFRFPGGGQCSVQQIGLMILAIATVAGYMMMLKRGSLGWKVQALYQNSELAEIVGINKLKLRQIMYLAGGSVAGLYGALAGADAGITPSLGFSPYILAVVAVMLAGPLAKTGLLISAVLLTVCVQTATWLLGAQFQNVTISLVLLIVLAARAFEQKSTSSHASLLL